MCGLFHTAYPSASETLKAELRSVFSQLCQYDMLMVSRAAASNFGKFAATVEAAHLKFSYVKKKIHKFSHVKFFYFHM